MKFRRKSTDPAPSTPEAPAGSEAAPEPESDPGTGPAAGPRDADDLSADELAEIERVDLGALLVSAVEGMEVRLQVDEATEEVQSVLLAGTDAAVELRVFAAPRHGDLWAEVRPQIAADFAQRGGTATEHDGRYGRELLCQVTVRTEDGRTGTQPSRVVGINGSRWMLRATMLGRAAVEPHAEGPWDRAIAELVVRRGSQAMPVGAELELTMPPRDKLVRRG